VVRVPNGLRRRGVVFSATLVLIAGGSAVAYASTRGSDVRYRTATVRTGNVDQLLTATGTTAVVNQASAHFRTSGTVNAVRVRVGDPVKAGQVLATLDPAPLTDAVTQATAKLAKSKAAVETDQSSTASSASSAASSATARTSDPAARPASTGARAATSSASGAVSAAQRAADQALHAAAAALKAAVSACAATPSPTPTPSPTAASPSAAAPPAPPPATCARSLQAALALQQKVAAAQQGLSKALSQAVRKAPTTTRAAAAVPSGRVPAAPSSNPAATSRTTAGQGGGSPSSSAGRLTTDRAAVVAAQSDLDVAEADLAGATLTSPISGTVASVPFTAGSAEATGDSATIVAPGPVTVTVNVPSTSIGSVKVRQRATVLADGATTGVAGIVTAIGLLPAASTANGTTSYPVTVLVSQPGKTFVDGAPASVSIVVKTVTGVVTVPNSAVSDGFVTVVAGGTGTGTRTRVQTGTVGALVTEVTNGLRAGQQVVLADLTRALPASSTTIPRRFGGGAFGGGGTGGGGFGGGGAGGVPGRFGRAPGG
jgi:multidrug efflux pump subunit AcrA (membrane-fusion protein)